MTYAKAFTAELENSHLNDLTNLTLNGNTSGEIVEEKLDHLGYAHRVSEKELEKSIESWRQPEDKLMYGEFLKVIKAKVKCQLIAYKIILSRFCSNVKTDKYCRR